MKLTPCLSLLTLSLGFIGLPAHSAWFDNDNGLRNGLQFGIRGTISPTLTQTDTTFNYLYDDPKIFNRMSNGKVTKVGTMSDVLAYKDVQLSDERIRLGDMDSGDVYFDVRKMLTRDTTLSGFMRLYGVPSGDRKLFYFYGANLEHDKYGAISLRSGNYNFRTSAMNTSGMYNPLETQAAAISAKYTYIPNLTLAGFYAFPASSDVRITNTSLHSGHGISAQYKWSLGALHNITLATGYTNNERHLDLSHNSIPHKKQAKAVALSYQYDNLTVHLDTGHTKEQLSGGYIDQVETKNYGIKLDYDFTPRLNAYVAYGEQHSDKSPTVGKSLNFDDLIQNASTVEENLIFDKVKKKRYQLGASYAIHHNISLIGGISNEKTTNYVVEGKFSERNTQTYEAGLQFKF